MTKKQKQKDSDIGLDSRQRNKIEPPKKYKVKLLNDDYTPMNFVTKILEILFHRSPAEATRIM